MFDLNGKYTTARIFTDNIENEAISQIYELCNQEFVEGCKVRIMPDVHAGKGCTIGTTMEIKDKVVPNLVGVDISCGVLCIKLNEKEIDFKFILPIKMLIKKREKVGRTSKTQIKLEVLKNVYPFLFCKA